MKPPGGRPGRASGPASGSCRRRGKAGGWTDFTWGTARPGRRRRDDVEGGGNAGPWTPRKTDSRFPSAPTALGNRCAIPTFPPPRRRFPFSDRNEKTPAAGRFAPAASQRRRARIGTFYFVENRNFLLCLDTHARFGAEAAVLTRPGADGGLRGGSGSACRRGPGSRSRRFLRW